MPRLSGVEQPEAVQEILAGKGQEYQMWNPERERLPDFESASCSGGGVGAKQYVWIEVHPLWAPWLR